jgi:2-amino-4-hydroxy-6-hydroxymethyldihydropteridine diphosphokinase
MPRDFIGMGSNLGDRMGHLRTATKLLAARFTLVRTSSVYESEPMYFEAQGRFLNCAAEIESDAPPRTLLRQLKSIELEVGRTPAPRYGPRVIDLDILLYDGVEIHESEELQIPHPRLAERAFVLLPLVELDPGLTVPPEGSSVAELLARLASGDAMKVHPPLAP